MNIKKIIVREGLVIFLLAILGAGVEIGSVYFLNLIEETSWK